MPFWLMLTMAKMKNTEFLSFHDEDTLCGFVYMATVNNLTFIMFWLSIKIFGPADMEAVF